MLAGYLEDYVEIVGSGTIGSRNCHRRQELNGRYQMRLIHGRGSITILRGRFLAAVPLAHAWEAEVTKTAAEQGSQRRGTLSGRRPETVRRLLISQAIACSRMDYRTKQ